MRKARLLTTSKRRRRVALLIESSRSYGRGLLLGIAKYVREHHEWTVQSEEWRWTDAPPKWLRTWEGDGIIARVETTELAGILEELGLPTVDVRGSITPFTWPLIDTEDKTVAHLAAEHLIDRGFRNYAYCGFTGANYSGKRSLWFEECLASHGFKCHIYSPPDYMPSDGVRDIQTIEHEKRGLLFQEHLARWLSSLPKPVGIMACNDIRGLQVMDICRRVDLVVPEQVAVIGVDNDEVLCELSDPPLSSVMPDTARIGYDAATLLEKMMAGRKPPPQSIFVPPLGIVTRRSTDVLAMEDHQLAAGVRFLREHAFDNLSVKDVARVAGMSRRVLERRFAQQLGRAPMAEVLRLRLERAKQLLLETDWNLSEIAERTGFKHVEYFHAMFTQKIGQTPGKFRRGNKETESEGRPLHRTAKRNQI